MTTVIITSGTTWAVPSGVTFLNSIIAVGGGGGGATGDTHQEGGGGGGSGEAAGEINLTVVPGTTATISLGAAGVASGNGSTTTFTMAGVPTITAHGGQWGGGLNAPGNGGTGSTNGVHADGGTGGTGSRNIGGGGGAVPAISAASFTNPGVTGSGGAAPTAGTNGCGGGGGCSTSGGHSTGGAAGGKGVVVVTYGLSGGSTNITDTDTFGGDDEVVQQTMAATDASNLTNDAAGSVLLTVGDAANAAADTPSLSAHPVDSDSVNGSAIDIPGNQILGATDASQAAAVEVPLPSPQGADASQAPAVEAGVLHATQVDADTFSQAVDNQATPASIIIAADASQAAAVEAGSIQTNLKSDTDAFNLSVDAPVLTSTFLADSDAGSGNEVGARNPVTDVDSFSGTDAVVAFGVIIADSDVRPGSTEAGGFGTIFTSTDASQAAAVEALTLNVQATDTIQGTDAEKSVPNAVLSDTETGSIVDTGFVNFDGTERTSKSLTTTWRALQRKVEPRLVDWRTLQRATKVASAAWKVVARRTKTATLAYKALQRNAGFVTPASADLAWNDYGLKTKTATIEWRAITRVSANRAYLAWNTLQNVIVTPLERMASLGWRTYDLVTKSASIEWDVLNTSRISKSCTTKWNSLARKFTPRELVKWNTRISHSKTGTIKWGIGGRPTKLLFTRWNDRKRIDKATSLGWDVRLKRSAAMAVIHWETEARTSKLLFTRFNTVWRNTRPTTFTLGWNTRKRPHESASLGWNVPAATHRISQSVTVKWDTLQLVSSVAEVQWNDRARTSVRTVEVTWSVYLHKVKSTPSIQWRQFQRITLVPASNLDLENGDSLDLQNDLDTNTEGIGPGTTWNISDRTSKPATLLGWRTSGRVYGTSYALAWKDVQRKVGRHAIIKWDVRNKATKSKSCAWNVYDPVAKSCTTKWNTLHARQHQSATCQWGIKTRKNHVPAGLHWKTRQHITKTATMAWDDYQRKHEATSLGWNTQPHVHTSCSLAWNSIKRVRQGRFAPVFVVEWQTMDSVTVTATIEWNVYKGAQGLIMNAPAAPWQSAYPSR